MKRGKTGAIERVMIGFGFTSDWMKKLTELLSAKQITFRHSYGNLLYTTITIADNEETLSHFSCSMHFYYCCSVIFVQYCLSGVLNYRRSGFGEHKPQIWSGPSPCFDKDGVMKFVSLMGGCK